MKLAHLLNLARNEFLRGARRLRRRGDERKAALAVEIADAIEAALDRILELEKQMPRTKQQAVDALIDYARTLKQENVTLKAQIANAPKAEDVVTDAEVQAIDELTPPPPDAQPAPVVAEEEVK